MGTHVGKNKVVFGIDMAIPHQQLRPQRQPRRVGDMERKAVRRS